jgi:hypothetical protein
VRRELTDITVHSVHVDLYLQLNHMIGRYLDDRVPDPMEWPSEVGTCFGGEEGVVKYTTSR